VKRLAPYIHAEALPWGLFSKTAREVGVTDWYVSVIFQRLRENDERLAPLLEG